MAAEGPIAKVERVIEQLAPMFQAEVDIHTYTRQIGQACREVLAIEKDYELTQEATLESVIAEILDYCGNDAAVQRVLHSVRSQAARIEPETGLNIPSLLISTWTMAKTVPYTNAEDLVIDNLRHNIATGGGCDAGISARLVLPYLHFLKARLEQRFNHTDVPVTHDDELERALAASYEMFAQQQQPVEDDELQTALAMSLSTAPKPIISADDFGLALGMALSASTPGVHYSYEAIVPDEEIDPELAEALLISRYCR